MLAHPAAVLGVAQIGRQEAGVAGGLRQAVAVQDAQAKLLLEALGQRHRQRACAADEVAETRADRAGDVFAGLQQELQNRRHHADDLTRSSANRRQNVEALKPRFSTMLPPA